MNDKLMSAIGLCRKAGALVIGADAASEAAAAKKARMMLLACDAAERTVGNAQDAAANGGISVIRLPYTIEQLASGLGRGFAVAAVTDGGLAKLIEKSQQCGGTVC